MSTSQCRRLDPEKLLERTESALAYRLAMEELSTSIASKLINVPAEELQSEILYSLKTLAEFAQVDRSYLFLLDSEQQNLECFAKWCSPLLVGKQRGIYLVDSQYLPWWYKQVCNGQVVHLPKMSDLPKQATHEYKNFTEQGIQSLLDVPIIYEERFVGIIGFDALQEEKEWIEHDIDLLKMLGGIFVKAIEHRKIQQHTVYLTELLHQSQKMETLGQLAAGIAHDLNNSLGAIRGHLELIRINGANNEKVNESVSIALEGCERSAKLIQRLLGFARKSSYNLKPLKINAVIQSNISFLGGVMQPDIDIIPPPPGEPFTIEADENQIHQIITNLLINAKHAMPRGGQVTIGISRQHVKEPSSWNPESKPGSYIAISVKDTGHGIEPHNLQRIFDPFFSTKRRGEGTGLGLSMVYGAMQHHNGWVNVHSKPEVGTEFELFFPEHKT